MKIYKTTQLPEESQFVTTNIGQVDYIDSYHITDDRLANYTVDYLTALLFMSKPPQWMQSLMTFRDWLVKCFGLKTGGNDQCSSYDETSQFSIGDKIGFFPVINRFERELIMAEADRHLSFWVSVLKTEKSGSFQLSVTTVVQYNNFWGKLYFIPVKPFHGIIVRSKIKQIISLL